MALILSLFLRLSLRLLLLRDALTGRRRRLVDAFPLENNRLLLQSEGRLLSAVHLSAGPATPAVLICHGIGELVEYWATVQQALNARGVSSLVFDYAGYGASTGTLTTEHCEEDAMAAFQVLAGHGYSRIFLLGYSLGAGVVTAVARRLPASGIILCESFTTLRQAAVAIGFPRPLTYLIPDTWQTLEHVRALAIPILVVHSDADKLFPVSMAERITDACSPSGQLIVCNNLSHNAPIFDTTQGAAEYWRVIAQWIQDRQLATSL